MARLAPLALCWALALAAPAYASELRCDPAKELEAAKEAMARGDREAALAHLLRADEILAACEEAPPRARPAMELEPTELLFASR